MNELLDRIDHVSICKDFLPQLPSPYKIKGVHTKLLINLFNSHNGHCFYCKRKTVMPLPAQTFGLPNMATKEHLYGVLDMRRALSGKVVLSCHDCNSKKGERDYETIKEPYRLTPYIKLTDLIELRGIIPEKDILYPRGFRMMRF